MNPDILISKLPIKYYWKHNKRENTQLYKKINLNIDFPEFGTRVHYHSIKTVRLQRTTIANVHFSLTDLSVWLPTKFMGDFVCYDPIALRYKGLIKDFRYKGLIPHVGDRFLEMRAMMFLSWLTNKHLSITHSSQCTQWINVMDRNYIGFKK